MPATQVNENIEINYLNHTVLERTEYLKSIFKVGSENKNKLMLNYSKWASLSTSLQISIIFDLPNIYEKSQIIVELARFLIITVLNKLYSSQRVIPPEIIEDRQILFKQLTSNRSRLIKKYETIKNAEDEVYATDLTASLDLDAARNIIFHADEYIDLATENVNPKFVVDMLDLRWQFSIESPKLGEKVKDSIKKVLNNNQVEKSFIADFVKYILDYLYSSYFSAFDAKLYVDVVEILKEHFKEDEDLLCFIDRKNYGIKYPGEESCSFLRSFKRHLVSYLSQNDDKTAHANADANSPRTLSNTKM